MRGMKMSWFSLILLFSFTINSLSEANISPDKKPPSAVVVGTVYCDTCFQADFSRSSHFISGASVAVECKDGNPKPSFRQEAKTDEHGEFRVNLPFSVSKHVKKIKRCSVKLINSSEPYCAVASTATSSSLHLKSRKQGIHVFSAGFFSFKPLKQPNLCNQKPSVQNLRELDTKEDPFDDPTFAPPIQEPATPDLPPLPLLPKLPPLPQLPPLPPLPGLPNLPPLPGKTPKAALLSDQKAARPDPVFPTAPTFPPNPFFPPNPLQPPSIFPPNPLQPPSIFPPNPLQPPSIFPPNPFQPPSIFPPNPLQPPSIFPPNPFQPPPLLPPNPLQPPPAPLFPLPPIPGLTPSPPPPAFPFPLPPFPFPPPTRPRFPGIPPRQSSP